MPSLWGAADCVRNTRLCRADGFVPLRLCTRIVGFAAMALCNADWASRPCQRFATCVNHCCVGEGKRKVTQKRTKRAGELAFAVRGEHDRQALSRFLDRLVSSRVTIHNASTSRRSFGTSGSTLSISSRRTTAILRIIPGHGLHGLGHSLLLDLALARYTLSVGRMGTRAKPA